MELTLSQPDLARLLALVGRAVSTRNVLPILSHFLLVAHADRVQIAATDLELSLTGWLDADITQPGALAIPARTFTELVNALPKDTLRLSLNPLTQILSVRGAGSHTQLKGMDAQEFPPLPQGTTPVLKLPAAELKALLPQVTLAASTDEARPALTGVLVNGQESTLTFAAADGYRLAERKLACPALRQELSLLIPARALHELGRLLNGSAETIELLISGPGQVLFRTPQFELATQLLDARFPDYAQVIPTQTRTTTLLPTAEFLKACKQAAIFARESAHTARLNIIPGRAGEPGEVKISAQDDETGSHETCVEAVVAGEPLQIAFNVRYLRDVLEVIPTPQVVLETNHPNTPGVVRPHGETGYLCVLMPMHAG